MRYFYTVLFLVYVVAITRAAVSAELGTTLRTLDSYSRFTLPLEGNPNYRVIESKPGLISLELQHIPPSTPFDELLQLNDKRVKKINYKRVGLDTVLVNIELISRDIEFFAYTQPNPQAILVDFWPKKGAVTAAARQIASLKEKKAALKKKSEAKVAVTTVQPLSLKNNFFQKFPQPMPPLEFKGKKFHIPSQTNVARVWKFSHLDKEKPEAENFNFAVGLFKAKKYGLAIRTVELTERDFPSSPHLPELRLLKAMAYKKLGEDNDKKALIEKSEEQYRSIMMANEQLDRSAEISHTLRIYFASVAYKNKQWLDAAEQFEYIAKTLQESDPDYPGIALAMADSYFNLNQAQRAERIFRYVGEKLAGTVIGKEAMYRLGNLLASEKKYARTIEEIEAIFKKYPDYIKNRPETLFNLAEAYFWTNNYEQSRKRFKQYVQMFPANTNSALAHVRLGEIAELADGDMRAARDYYMTSVNRFPFSDGSVVASVRLARLNSDKPSERDYEIGVLSEIMKSKKGDRTTYLMAQSALIDYLLKAGHDDKAIQISREGMQENTGEAYDIFKTYSIQALLAKFARLTHEKKYNEALAHYEAEKQWLASAGPEVYRHLADVYRGLNLFDTSNHYMALYQEQLKKAGRSIASTGENQKINYQKALNYYQQGKYAEALVLLPSLEPKAEVLVMRANALFKIGQKKESYIQAEKAFNALLAAKDKLSADDWHMDIVDMTDILVSQCEHDKNYKAMEELLQRTRSHLDKKEERLEFMYADAIWYQSKHRAAIAAYTAALEEYPKSDRKDRAAYNMAMSQIALGKKPEAVKLLTQLRDSSQNAWALSAKRELELIDWESKYSTVLRTLPPAGLGVVN